MEKSTINNSFSFGWRFVLLICWVWVAASQAQQTYVNNHQLDCDNYFKETEGFECNGPESCISYFTYRSAPPYDSPRSISFLLNSDPALIASINEVPLNNKIAKDTLLIVPVGCSCSGSLYQHNASYTTINDSETYFTIANNTYQGLTTCQALRAQNPFDWRNLTVGMDLLIPLRCACPVDILIESGYNYLLSYLVTWGDSISSIAQTFNVEVWTIYAANNFYSSSELIFPFTQILIPLKVPPTALFQTPPTSNCRLHDSLVYEIF